VEEVLSTHTAHHTLPVSLTAPGKRQDLELLEGMLAWEGNLTSLVDKESPGFSRERVNCPKKLPRQAQTSQSKGVFYTM